VREVRGGRVTRRGERGVVFKEVDCEEQEGVLRLVIQYKEPGVYICNWVTKVSDG
jgi:hypothetical protein